jgi:hypothetical protein
MHLDPKILIGKTIDFIHLTHNCWTLTLVDAEGKDTYYSLWSDNNNLNTSAGIIPGLSLEEADQYNEPEAISPKRKK